MRFYVSPVKSENARHWGWTARGLDNSYLGAGIADSLPEVRNAIEMWFLKEYGFALIGLCVCGGGKIGMRAHEPGHSHWCPVAPVNCVVLYPDDAP